MRILLLLLFFSCGVCFAKSSQVSDITIKNYKSAIEISGNTISLYQRQLLTVHVELFTNEEFSYLKTDKLEDNDYLIDVGLLTNESTLSKNRFKKSIRVFVWPLKSGQQSLEIPEIRLVLSGRTIYTVKIPTLQLKVLNLPDYLPPGFPVGNISIDSGYNSEVVIPYILTPNELASYSLFTTSSGVHPTLIPDYSSYLRSDSITQLFKSNEKEVFIYDLGYSYSKTQLIPIISKFSGLSKFEDFNVLFFEPVSEKVNSFIFESVTLITFNLVLKVMGLIAGLYLIYRLILALYYFKTLLMLRRDCWRAIYLATNSTELSQSLRRLQPINPFKQQRLKSDNMSLLQWATLWQDSRLLQAIDPLIIDQFSCNSKLDFEQNKRQIISRIKSLDHFMFFFSRYKVL